MKRVLFLYTELAEYFLACLQVMQPEEYEVHVVRWPVNKEAPFAFRSLEHIHMHDRDQWATEEQLTAWVQDLHPHVVFTSGWVDKGYLAVNRMLNGQVPTVLLLDNHWSGSFKQQLARLLSGRLIHRYFSHAWVPGAYQHTFARKLGFKPDRIREDFYCADTALFDGFYAKRPADADPKRLLFVGRYLDFKGIFDLWQVFAELHGEGFSDWELWCAGSGDLWDQRVEHPAIKHYGFVQPAELEHLVLGSSAFVLPSHKEPWGVVIHEMAAAGLPLVCSNAVGAATRFVEEGHNGFMHAPADLGALKAALKKLMVASPTERQAMGRHSRKLAESLTPQHWSRTLAAFIPS